MIYDLCMYSGEKNILEIRLNELNNIVDKFIILESTKSHTRLPKPLYFLEQQEHFKYFKDKIEYYNLDYCNFDNPFINDQFGRCCLWNIVKNRTSDKDFILAGDLDEIPNFTVLKRELENYNEPITLLMKNRVLCLDLEQKGLEFPGTSILKSSIIDAYGIYFLRDTRQNSQVNLFKLVKDAGWHFTYCAGLEKTLNKMKYFAHASETVAWAKTKEDLINCIKFKTSLDKETKLESVPINSNNFPKFVLENQDKYKEFLSFYY